MDQTEQFAALVADKIESRDCNIRNVEGGFVLTALRRWTDPATGTIAAQIQYETVATNHRSASDKAADFLESGVFAAYPIA